MKAVCLVGLMILMFTPAPLVYAQVMDGPTIQTGMEQVPGTTTTDSVKRTKEVGPQGQVVEKEVKTTSSKRDHAVINIPASRANGPGESAIPALMRDLVKDTGPKLRYTVDRLPAGANPEEALWVKMRDGRMMMVDPKLVQNLH